MLLALSETGRFLHCVYYFLYSRPQNSGTPFRGARAGFSRSPGSFAAIARGVSVFAGPVRGFRKTCTVFFLSRVSRARDKAGRAKVRARFSPFFGVFGTRSVRDRLPGIATKVSIPRAASGVRFSRRGDAFSEGPRVRRGRLKGSTFR